MTAYPYADDAEAASLSRASFFMAHAVPITDLSPDEKHFADADEEVRIAELDRELTRPAVDREGIRRALAKKIGDWRALLRGSPTHGRVVLGRLLNGCVQIYRTDSGIAWGALGAPEELLKGLYRRSVSGVTKSADRGQVEADLSGLYTCVASPSRPAPHVRGKLRRAA